MANRSVLTLLGIEPRLLGCPAGSLVTISTNLSPSPLIKLSYNLFKYLHKIYQPKLLTCQYYPIFYNPAAYTPNPPALKTSLVSSEYCGLTKSTRTAPSYHLRAKYFHLRRERKHFILHNYPASLTTPNFLPTWNTVWPLKKKETTQNWRRK